MGYRIVLDIGIASVGYAVLKTDEKGNPYKIENFNTVRFPISEKEGKLLNIIRREKRSAHRRNRRIKFRKYRTKQLFIRHKLLTKNEIQQIFTKLVKDIYMLRVKALEELISHEELFRIFYFFAGHRGFKSNRTSELKEKDMGPILQAIQQIDREIEQKGYRTIGEYLYKEDRYSEHKRNKDRIDGGYLGTVKRELIEKEIKMIIDMQRGFGNTALSLKFEIEFIGNEEQSGIFNAQRSFDEGPGEGPYSGNQIEKMIGICTFDKEEKRAPKASFTYQYFSLLCKVNNLKYKETLGSNLIEFNETDRKKIIEKALQQKKVTFITVKNLTKIPKESRFNLLNYSSEESLSETEKSVFYEMKAYHELKSAFVDSEFKEFSTDELDKIGYALTVYKGDKARIEYLKNELNLPIDTIELLLPFKFSGFGHLSIKTMQKIIPFLEEGLTYDKACQKAGYDFQYNKITREYIYTSVVNPVVKRAVTKAIKVVDTLIKEYGEPDAIHIELSREIGKSAEERQKIIKKQASNQKNNQKIIKKLQENNISINGENITRLKLWEEQKNHDLYEDKVIPFEKVFSSEYEVDHIIPYSISFDDSFNNKILVSKKANQEKGNRLPKSYLGKNNNKFEELVSMIKNPQKREKLLKIELTDEEKRALKTRSLNDTRHITTLMHSYLLHNIQYSNKIEKKQRVVAVNGAITAKLRARWGFNKLRENSDKHHALDALVVACITSKYIKEVTNYSKINELRYNTSLWKNKDIIEVLEQEIIHSKIDYNRIFNQKFPVPWFNFRKEVLARLSDNPKEKMKNLKWDNYTDEEIEQLKPMFVVRVPNRKIKKAAHKESIYSGKLYKEQNNIIKRCPIQKLTLNHNGEIVRKNEKFYCSEDRGWLTLYNAIKEKLQEYGGNGEEAFPNGELEYKQGEHIFKVRKVKMVSNSTIGVALNEGKSIAKNDNMIRIDVYKTSKKYVYIPIYANDVVKVELPVKACVAGKNYDKWLNVNDDEFLFSLYPGDLINLKSKSGITLNYNGEINGPTRVNELLCYYVGADISNANISIEAHDRSFKARTGIARLLTLEKYQIDYLGNYYKVHEKKRQSFTK